MRQLAAVLLIVGAFVATAPPAFAGGRPIKLATLAPDGSPWHDAMMELADEWRRGTDGRVGVRIYAGGVAGDDPDMVRKIRIGQLQAAALTVTGLSEIDKSFYFFSIPMFFESDAEFVHVLEKMTPTLSARLESKGFVLLHWGHGGWVRFFSKRELQTIDQLEKAKIFAWAGDDDFVQLWKTHGFRPVALAATDILTGLQTGMIDTLPSTPLAALSLQWFRQTPYMLDEGVAPLVGATVISAKAWKGIAESDRSAMRAAAAAAERRLAREIPEKDDTAVEEMTRRGLTVLSIAPGHRAEWTDLAASFSKEMSRVVPPEVWEEALRHRDAFRRDNGGGGEGTP